MTLAGEDFPVIHRSIPGNRQAPCNDGADRGVQTLLASDSAPALFAVKPASQGMLGVGDHEQVERERPMRDVAEAELPPPESDEVKKTQATQARSIHDRRWWSD